MASLVLAAFACADSSTPAAEPQPTVVKKSRKRICHEPGSDAYERTKTFKPFESLEACLASGGRRAVPRGTTGPAKRLVRLSENGVCHPPASAGYDRLKNYRTYASMDECIAAGGRERASN
jgi:hypothetical protein